MKVSVVVNAVELGVEPVSPIGSIVPVGVGIVTGGFGDVLLNPSDGTVVPVGMGELIGAMLLLLVLTGVVSSIIRVVVRLVVGVPSVVDVLPVVDSVVVWFAIEHFGT